MLYLIATPIGNLSDITLRALDTLKTCDLILCEDTRVSLKLLSHYGIDQPLESFHRFSESSKEERVINLLKEGRKIALISDAGTPGIADPGERIVARCRKEQIPVIPLPGPCAAIAALSASGLRTDHFQFLGFLPRKPGPLRQLLLENWHYEGTSICYESPERLLELLKTVALIDPARELVVFRELTKLFEEWNRGPADKLIAHYSAHPPKGEIVVLISGDDKRNVWKELSPKEHVRWLQETYSLNEREAIKLSAELRGSPKRAIYSQLKGIGRTLSN